MMKKYPTRKPVSQAAAATGSTDAESGNEGESVARELFALNAMYERGLIPEAEYQARKAELEAAGKSDA
ncbi:MAG TPA: hypothetical protein DFI00_01260 [Rhodospirillaceae bacterium]|nr:hypothetical protein [Alphaproteobacteria bacterium]OUT41670.1 MAG: hypothetical protein CBB62_04920 [Micavibrio sp. TMED2]HCI45900.1 hypothetical protein [Rhodospirillaceae bacterium]MAS46759.1 hypothetical protein [Alphaproteobacteria bacterium]MAX94854.1 hypothetical protein [Alphaproteobacteria bacterium]|tara:strand:+ start:920 stop:1126 length:207 start_codon:yes stop_codon:yes gene_type:complete